MASTTFCVSDVAEVLSADKLMTSQKMSLLSPALGHPGPKWYAWNIALASKRKTARQILTEMLNDWVRSKPEVAGIDELKDILTRLNLESVAEKLGGNPAVAVGDCSEMAPHPSGNGISV